MHVDETDRFFMANLNAVSVNLSNGLDADWEGRHNAAIFAPRAGGEATALLLCRTAHTAATLLKDDGYGIPNVVIPTIRAAMGYLNFDLGRLDGGTLDGALRALAKGVGWDLDTDAWAA